MKIKEAASVLNPHTDLEGPMFEVVLISEGLGNKRNMNYYGPEAIQSAPAAFEGKPCFINHPTLTDDREIPERKVESKCGYFKGCKVVQLQDGRLACVGEFHADLSESGQMAYQKGLSALHYRTEFPGSESEYVGFSVNADGDTDRRTMEIDGESLDVNYVTRFTEGASVDLVTQPARGGRFLALVEDVNGAPIKAPREVNAMIVKTLEAAIASLKESEGSKDSEEAKKKVLESKKALESLLAKAKEAIKKAKEGEAEDENEEESEADPAMAEHDDAVKSRMQMYKMGSKHATTDLAKKGDDGDDDDDGDEAESEAEDKSDAMEAKRVAIRTLMKEANLAESYLSVDELVSLSFREAKKRISQMKSMRESVVKDVVKSLDLPPVHMSKFTEGGNSNGASNQDIFESVR